MKKALLVGINDYPGTCNDLMGCVNDVGNIQNLLVSIFGFNAENITVITNRDATTLNILNGLNTLVSNAEQGDLLVFHYSGHGSQVADTEGDETDRLDEVLCPYDIDWKSKMIRDNDLAGIFKSVPPGVQVEIFLDSCHSGTGLKGMATNNGNYRRARFLAPPLERMTSSLKAPIRVISIRPAKAQVLWAACRSNQVASDALIDGQYGGAFTRFLCDLVREAEGNIKRQDLIRRLGSELKKAGFSQVPSLETNRKLKKVAFLTAYRPATAGC